MSFSSITLEERVSSISECGGCQIKPAEGDFVAVWQGREETPSDMRVGNPCEIKTSRFALEL